MRAWALLALLLAGCAGGETEPVTGGKMAVEVDTGNPCRDGGCEAVVMNATGLGRQAGWETLVIFHPGERPATAVYEAHGVPRPDVYTILDATVDWAAKVGVVAEYVLHPGDGLTLATLDDLPAQGEGRWRLWIAGEPVDVRIDATAAIGQEEMTWRLD